MSKQDKNKAVKRSDKNIITKNKKFSINSKLHLKLLIDFWRNEVLANNIYEKIYSTSVEEQLALAPELLEPIEDLSIIDKHRELIDLLMTVIFPQARSDTDIAAAYIPFTNNTIYATPTYRRLFDYIQQCDEEKKSADNERMYLLIMLHAYKSILKRFYDVTIDFDFPMIMNYIDRETGFEKFYKIEVDPQFAEIINLGPLTPLTDEDKKRLHDNLTDLKVWEEILPIENFEFRGFAIYKATDVTDNELLSQLKYEMSKKDVLNVEDEFNTFQQKLRSLLKLNDLRAGITGVVGEKELVHNCGHSVGKGLLLSLTEEYCPANFQKSIYGKLMQNRKPVIIFDLEKYPEKTTIEEEFLENGFKNVALFPLIYENQMIGVFELATETPNAINGINTLKLDSLMPLFVIAVRRHLEEIYNRVQRIIKEECTAIHPSVEWRFRTAAFNKIQKENIEGFAEMEPIVFDNVYSLYGLSDIRGSSTKRNQVIQEDLIEHLSLAKQVIDQAYKAKPLPVYQEYIYRLEKYQASIAKNLNADEESHVLDFLHREIEPLFDHVEKYDKKVEHKINAYRKALDPVLGFVYNKRKEFDQSVAQINDAISAFIEVEEDKAQLMFPHYFEKYKTDGVDYNVYIGSSLVEEQEFNPIYLKNIRLWQLLLTCGIVEKANALKNELKMPLETAHLILIQNTPISIQFRFDEKRFDVNGAYNVKYEIVKKRIDKAVIKSTKERLTQPGKIAIVYSQSKDAYEYREYIDFLQHQGYLKDEIEDVELEDMQGVQGLRALRITVNLQKGVQSEEIVPESVEQAIREMSENA
jgi:hypothetical protein